MWCGAPGNELFRSGYRVSGNLRRSRPIAGGGGAAIWRAGAVQPCGPCLRSRPPPDGMTHLPRPFGAIGTRGGAVTNARTRAGWSSARKPVARRSATPWVRLRSGRGSGGVSQTGSGASGRKSPARTMPVSASPMPRFMAAMPRSALASAQWIGWSSQRTAQSARFRVMACAARRSMISPDRSHLTKAAAVAVDVIVTAMKPQGHAGWDADMPEMTQGVIAARPDWGRIRCARIRSLGVTAG